MQRIRRGTFIVTTLLIGASCTEGETTSSAQVADPSAATLTAADVARLRWLEGTWRGTGETQTQAPFYEEYRFADDSTLISRTYADSTFTKVTDSSRYELRGRRMASTGSGRRWHVTKLPPDSSVTFHAIEGPGNSFTWTPVDANHWTAVLVNPPREPGGAGQTITYAMTRWSPANAR